MTTTVTPDRLRAVRAVLERADRRHAVRTKDVPATPEYLDALARAVTPEAGDAVAADPAALDALRDAVVAAEQDRARALAGLDDAQRLLAQRDGQIKSLTKEVEQHQENTTAVRHTLQARIDELTVELGNAHKELAAARAEHATATTPAEHRHRYPISDTGQILPCDVDDCGHPYPRDVLAELLADTEDDEPDVEPMAALLARVREELTGWGGS